MAARLPDALTFVGPVDIRTSSDRKERSDNFARPIALSSIPWVIRFARCAIAGRLRLESGMPLPNTPERKRVWGVRSMWTAQHPVDGSADCAAETNGWLLELLGHHGGGGTRFHIRHVRSSARCGQHPLALHGHSHLESRSRSGHPLGVPAICSRFNASDSHSTRAAGRNASCGRTTRAVGEQRERWAGTRAANQTR